jgi:hypothetical protein
MRNSNAPACGGIPLIPLFRQSTFFRHPTPEAKIPKTAPPHYAYAENSRPWLAAGSPRKLLYSAYPRKRYNSTYALNR